MPLSGIIQGFTPLGNSETDLRINSIKEVYSILRETLNPSKLVEAVKEKATRSEKIKELQEKISQKGLHLDICGRWLWIIGKTYRIRNILKEFGFRYSDNKLS